MSTPLSADEFKAKLLKAKSKGLMIKSWNFMNLSGLK